MSQETPTSVLDPLTDATYGDLILQYLLHERCAETAEAFRQDRESSQRITTNVDSLMNQETKARELETRSLQLRKEMMAYILNGEIPAALNLIKPGSPLGEVLYSGGYGWLYFELLAQNAIEAIRSRDVYKAIEAGRLAKQNLTLSGSDDEAQLSTVRDIMALLAYEVPEKSPLSHYMSDARRINLAEKANAWLAETHGLGKRPVIETIVRHTTVALEATRAAQSAKSPGLTESQESSYESEDDDAGMDDAGIYYGGGQW